VTKKEAHQVLMIMYEEGEEFFLCLVRAFYRKWPEFDHMVLACHRMWYRTYAYPWETHRSEMQELREGKCRY